MTSDQHHNVLPALTDSLIPLANLHPHPQNARRRDERAQTEIRQSLTTNGQYRRIVTRRLPDGTLQILAGHGTTDAARDLGWTHIAAEVHDDVDDQAAARIVAVDNRTSDLSEDDPAALTELLSLLDALEGTGWTGEEAAAISASLHAGEPEQLTDPDDAPPVPADPQSKVGDVWDLGPHRLVVARAEDALAAVIEVGDVEMVLTDPPYGMRLEADWSGAHGTLGSTRTSGNRYEPVLGDHEDFDPRPVLGMVDAVAEQFWFGADYYADRIPHRVAGSWLVWDKRAESQADGIGSEFELVWSRQRHKRRMLRHDWFGFLASGSNAGDARRRLHPTQKPVTLLEDILTQWAPDGCVVLDPYAGSGSTLIACHQTGRTARLIELDPHYADVILRRYAEHTGQVPTHATTGIPFELPAPE